MKTIYLSDAPNYLEGYDYFKYTPLAKVYNYTPIIHDAWVFLAAIQKQMEKLYGKKEDLPSDFKGLFEEDLPVVIKWLKSWMVQNLHECGCARSYDYELPSCGKCMEGKTGWRLSEYVGSHMGDD